MNEVETPEPSRKNIKSYRRHGSRYKARRRGVDILYEAESRDVDPVAIVHDRVELSSDNANQVAPVSSYTQQIVAGVAEELDQIDEVISTYLSTDWELHRISAVDRAILRVAVWELIFNEEVPLKTVLSEAVELAAQYSGAKAPAYINAVLDSAVKDIDELRAQPTKLDDSKELTFEEALEVAEQLLDTDADPAPVAVSSADPEVSQAPVSDSILEEAEQAIVQSDSSLVDSAPDMERPEAAADFLAESNVVDAGAEVLAAAAGAKDGKTQSEVADLSEKLQKVESATPQSQEPQNAESGSRVAVTEIVSNVGEQEPPALLTERVAAEDTESGEASASAHEEDS